MKIAKVLGACVMVAVTILGCKKQQNVNLSEKMNGADSNFVMLAGPSNYSQIETAKVAVSKASDSLVLVFAQQMLSEYTKAQSDLKVMGTIVGFTVKDTIDAAHNATIAQLDTLTARAFDSAYIHTQISDHQAMINFYSDELKNGRQINVQGYANAILQSIQTDLQTADSIAVAF